MTGEYLAMLGLVGLLSGTAAPARVVIPAEAAVVRPENPRTA